MIGAKTTRSAAFTTSTPSTMLPKIAEEKISFLGQRTDGAIQSRSSLVERTAQHVQRISSVIGSLRAEIAFGHAL